MNNREAIDHVRAWHNDRFGTLIMSAMDVVLALAEAQVQRTPPEGAVEVMVAVAKGSWCFGSYAADDASDALAMKEASDGIGQVTHAAIVHAWIPPVAVPVVEGEVQG